MLTDDQIGYLLQIRDTKPALSEKTVRVMLGALRWSSESIDDGIKFLKLPPAPEGTEPIIPEEFKESSNQEELPLKQINIKQNPFPIGSPLINSPKRKEWGISKIRINPITAGLIVGVIVLFIWLVMYAKIAQL